MSIEEEQDRLSQQKMLEHIRREPQITEMITVYLSDSGGSHNYGIYCALVPSAQIEQTLSDPSWDLSHGQGHPGVTVYHKKGKDCPTYLRYGDDTGIEPLVIDREFYGMRDDYKEISEEFRLFHRLYHDRKQNKYIKIDDEGNEEIVAEIEENHVKIRLKEIRQFLAIKEMHLSIQFDCREHSELSLEQLKLKTGGKDYRDNLICWGHGYGDFSGIGKHRAFSRLLGKCLIPPLPKSKSGLWGFAEEEIKKHAEFIIGNDENGEEVTFSSNPDGLANNFGANPEAPNYLTPVHFKKQVLDKYYQQPSKYSVEDSILRCGSLWSMYIDNHHDDKVCVWLGDLGRDLPYKEQLHWLSHNILPTGKISETYFKRQIMAQFTNSDRPEHLFGSQYHELAQKCDKYLGWQLLLPLAKDDEHHIQGIRIPATDEQRDFDELILGLTKILIDSLNEKKLNQFVSSDERGNIKGSIARLEKALHNCGFDDYAEPILFLRKLQNLRSTSAAHRKGSNYQKIAKDFGVENQSLRLVFSGILQKALITLEYLIAAVESDRFKKSEQIN